MTEQKQYTYKCNKCVQELINKSPNEKITCYKPMGHRTSGLCLGQYELQLSQNIKAIRQFYHIIANYVKLQRIVSK